MATQWGRDQEKLRPFKVFQEGKKDVLMATDVASESLDFSAFQHVINREMPEQTENYMQTAVLGTQEMLAFATTFINRACDGLVLVDLESYF